MLTLILFIIALGLVAAAAVSAPHDPLPTEQALPIGVLGLAWRSAGQRNTRNGPRTLWRGEGDTAWFGRAYSADRDGMRAVGFSWDDRVPVCWEAIPALSPMEVWQAVERAEAAADSAERTKEAARLAAAEKEWAEGGAVRAEAIDALRACLATRAWAWNKRKRGLATSLLGDRPSDRDARLARELVGEVELLVRTVTQRLGEERIGEWWERAGVAEVRASAHKACRTLSEMDADWATVRNARG